MYKILHHTNEGKMKKLILLYVSILIGLTMTLSACQQTSEGDAIPEPEGTWKGMLSIGIQELTIVFHIEKTEDGNWKSTMDSPDQGVTGIEIKETIIDKGSVEFNVPILNGEYHGVYNTKTEQIEGTWSQNGMDWEMNLKKVDESEVTLNRPQEPKRPYPYKEELVTFKNQKENIELAGTFTYPDGKGVFPAVVLITGSGAQDRDESLMGHKPFLVLADYLTRNGIAVLRYDDRGFGESGGNRVNATIELFANDAYAAYEYLKTREEVNPMQIGLIGHSEGAIISGMLAAKHSGIAFIVLLGGPSVRGDETVLKQTEILLAHIGMAPEQIENELTMRKRMFSIVEKAENPFSTKNDLKEILLEYYPNANDFQKERISELGSYWYKHFLAYKPGDDLQKVSCPVLALYGEKDFQVDPSQNAEPMRKALEKSNSSKYDVIVLESLNHLFQKAETGMPEEYSKIEETMNPKALETILKWITSITEY